MSPTHSGIMLDPFRYDDWVAKAGVRPTALMEFQKFGQGVPTLRLNKLKQLGIRWTCSTWEPWGAKGDLSGTYSCESIALGAHDDLIVAYAKALTASGVYSCYLRFGHEMQGDWYPWSDDPVAYVAAFRRIASLMREHSPVVRLLWAPNSNLYQNWTTFLAEVTPYWPGKAWVDLVGVTSINFSDRPPQHYGQRALELANHFKVHKIVMPEINTQYEGRVQWLQGMREWTVANRNRIMMAALSQPAVSGGQASIPGAGFMQWRAEDDLEARPVVQQWFGELEAA